ncbi:MAG TPA: serine hydrolase domain-containing protein [Rhodopila sp.]|uniref:serine hydrolase domain-containing protein n=1 Tax=Rhodopila sp. TaxID=2480087 RepID=UPI002C5E9040|nr:serine hydrolase domain-containing protein [Rhodopila sp.]HVY16854.1 serine hydrolase domain-containing protein [Rhodopila sp.]
MADTEQIASVLRQAVDRGDVPGVAAAAANRDGVIFQDGFGTRDTATGAPMAADTVVWIASMTKAVTGACAMQLVEQGKLSLDGDIADVLPELGHVQVLEGFDPSGKPRLRPARGAITLRQLLTHTAGYAYEIWNADIVRYQRETGIPGISSCRNAALSVPLVFDPGTKWTYGISIDWVGKAVEAASGLTLDRYMRDHILAPLGMSDTGFRIGPDQRQRLAKIHAHAPQGFVSTDMEVPQEPEFHMGGGGLYSTVGDYLKFARMVMQGGALDGVRVLKPETVAVMARNAMGELVCEPMKTAAPGASNDVDFVAGMKWGLSFLINPDAMPTGRSAGSLAWAGLANSYFWIDPARQVAGVYATQILPFFDQKAVQAFQDFETAVYRTV